MINFKKSALVALIATSLWGTGVSAIEWMGANEHRSSLKTSIGPAASTIRPASVASSVSGSVVSAPIVSAAQISTTPEAVNAAGGVYNNNGTYDGTRDLPKHETWMSWIKDDTRIRDISIPGTHDSGAQTGPLYMAINQSLTITQQLSAGIRYLDVRLRHIDNRFAIHHGEIYQQMMFGQVLNDISEFLRKNPSEFVFVRVKEEHVPQGVTRTFEHTFDYYRRLYEPVIWKPTQSNPRLAEVRGRIVFIQQFASRHLPPVGLGYETFAIQDHWEFGLFDPMAAKVNLVKDTINRSLAQRTNMINNLSVSAPPKLPKHTANSINNGVYTYLQTHVLPRSVTDRFVGIMPMDYPGAGIIDSIIRSNDFGCAIHYLDARTMQLATCYGQGMSENKNIPLPLISCSGDMDFRNGIACYYPGTRKNAPVSLALQEHCSVLSGYEGRYLTCDNSNAATHTAPEITCNGYVDSATGLCRDGITSAVKPLELNCYGTPVRLPSDSIMRFGCSKP